MKFYNQVNAKHRAEAAALIDDLLTSSTDAEATDHEKVQKKLDADCAVSLDTDSFDETQDRFAQGRLSSGQVFCFRFDNCNNTILVYAYILIHYRLAVVSGCVKVVV